MSSHFFQKKNGRRVLIPATEATGRDGVPSINATKLAILITFLKILVKGKSHYCEPHPDTARDLLKKYHGIEIQRRWFFQCMADLETSGYMRRQRRWIRHDNGDIESNSSLWWFTLRGAKYLARKSIQGSQDLLRSMISWLHLADDRRPTAADLCCETEPVNRDMALQRLRDLIHDIG
jgi:hypothetical protein